MFTIPDSYRVNSNDTDFLDHIKGPYEGNKKHDIYWGRNQNDAIILCFSLNNLERIYARPIELDLLKDYYFGLITFKDVIQNYNWISITDGQLYGEDVMKKYLFPVSEIPELELLEMDYKLIPPPSNKEFYIL